MASDIGVTPDPQEALDHLAIREVLACHSRGLDRGDGELLSKCYWPEAEVDYGSYKGPADVFAALIVPVLQEKYQLTRHCLTNTLIEFRGEQALSESNVDAAHLLPGATEEMLFAGRYLDRLEKRDGCWKLAHRRVVVDWVRTCPLRDETSDESFADLSRGSHEAGDPLQEFLAQEIDHG